MPFDQLDFETKPAPLTDAEIWSLPRFVAWLETMPAEQSYRWDCTNGSCLIDQYAGRKDAWRRAPQAFSTVAYNEDAHGGRAYASGGTTFGAALSRARAELAKVSK